MTIHQPSLEVDLLRFIHTTICRMNRSYHFIIKEAINNNVRQEQSAVFEVQP